MDILVKLKTEQLAGKKFYWKGRKVKFIDFLSMNLGGDIKIRLRGNRKNTVVNVFEITTSDAKN